MFDAETQPERAEARLSVGRVCVLVSSSDRGRDIFEIVFQNSDAIWRSCDWPRYVGFTTQHPDMYGFKALSAKHPSNWQGELADQVEKLPEQIEYVLLTFEDALFLSPVDGPKLNEIAALMAWEKIAYLSLLPVARNLLGLVIEFFRKKSSNTSFRLLSYSEPYYSSVAQTIWSRSHLLATLRTPGSIWDFEHIVTKERHYAVWEKVLDQDQIVTRGKWDHQARRQLARQGLSLSNTKREFRTYKSYLRDLREWIVFQLVGFLSFRVRRRLNKISHRLNE
jgi:hypothetical protein